MSEQLAIFLCGMFAGFTICCELARRAYRDCAARMSKAVEILATLRKLQEQSK